MVNNMSNHQHTENEEENNINSIDSEDDSKYFDDILDSVLKRSSQIKSMYEL